MDAVGVLTMPTAEDPMEEDMLELLIAIGHYARSRRRFDDAVYLFERLAVLYPQRAFPYLGLGLTEVERANFRKASILFERAVAAAPDETLPRAWLGASLIFEKKYAAGARLLVTVAGSDESSASSLASMLLDLPECAPYRSTAQTTQSIPTLQKLIVRQRQ